MLTLMMELVLLEKLIRLGGGSAERDVSNVCELDDIWVWKYDVATAFSVKSAYNAFKQLWNCSWLESYFE
jgi:hypothetical protein